MCFRHQQVAYPNIELHKKLNTFLICATRHKSVVNNNKRDLTMRCMIYLQVATIVYRRLPSKVLTTQCI